MDPKTVTRTRRHALYAELRESDSKWQELLRLTEAQKQESDRIRARLEELRSVEKMLAAPDQDEAGELDQATHARLSELIISVLQHMGGPDGLTIANFSEALPPSVTKQHLSATLYNLKKRNIISHSEATGRYRLPRNSPAAQRFEGHCLEFEAAERPQVPR